jgi:hypothetical protein
MDCAKPMRALLTCLLISLPATGGELRSWTDSLDRKIDAELLKIDGDNVVLKLKDGREIPYPLAKLSAADRTFVDGQRASLPAATAAAKPSTALNFDSPWPERITFTEDPEINIVEEDADNKRFIYESANYRYTCDVRLSKMVVKGFAVMFEATNLYCATIPLALNGGSPAKGKHQILLFEHKENYIQAGGPPSSAGVFIGGKGVVMVPLESLGVRPVGSGYMLDREKSNKTLPHELTHQLTPNAYYESGSMGWFSEGIAEYIAITPYRSGSYNVRGNFKDIVEYATGYGKDDRGGRALGTRISLPPLKKFMLQSYDSFLSESQLNYGAGLLITTYFLHLDGDGSATRVKAFLKALRDKKEGEAALAVLLDGRSFEQMEQEIIKGWGRKGVTFSFGASEKQ